MSDFRPCPKAENGYFWLTTKPAIAAMGARTLEQLGYTVTVKTSAKEALDRQQLATLVRDVLDKARA